VFVTATPARLRGSAMRGAPGASFWRGRLRHPVVVRSVGAGPPPVLYQGAVRGRSAAPEPPAVGAPTVRRER
jgi:hypothetical protein